VNIPPDLRKPITDVAAVLLSRQGVAEDTINAVIDTIEKKEGSHMFDRLVEGLLKERQALVEETWTKAEAKTRAEVRTHDREEACQHLLESARKPKAKGYPVGDIAESLSLPEEDAAALKP
jgi:hypothetical protein